jgi:site-specific DNA-adenine methylase
MAYISYFGGKSSSAFMDLINSRIPKSGIKTYIEPFSGSFATYLDDPNLNFETVIYNDKNRHQVNLYKCCQEPDKFLPILKKLKETVLKTDLTDKEEKRLFYRDLYKKYTTNDFLDNMNFEIGDFKRAAIYAFLITSSFSSVYPKGGGFVGYKKDKDELKLDVLIRKLMKGKYSNRKISEFYNIDFEELITKYDSEDTFLYLDPPYARFDEKKGEDDAKRLFWYGCDDEGTFGPASHRRLLELIKKSKSRWALSYYYFPLLEELLPKDEYFWVDKEVIRSSAHGGNNADKKETPAKGVELLIMNYNPETGEKIKINNELSSRV